MHLHLPHVHYALNRELTELYASIALRNFTLGLITIFEPIYLYLYFGEDISKTLVYFGVISLAYGLISPFAGKLVTRLGVKHSILISIPFAFLYYLGLWHIDKFQFLLPLLVLTAVVHKLFYWTAFHIDFARFSEKQNRGKQLSYRHTIAALSAASAPFIGGIIIAELGYGALFVAVLALFFASVFPLFLSKEIHESFTDGFEKVYHDLFQKKHRNQVLALASQGIEPIAAIFIWPIFLFSLSITYISIGFISAASLFAGTIFALFLGRLIDKVGHARLLSIGVWLNALTWPVRMFVQTPLEAFMADSLNRFARLAAYMPFVTLFYDWAGREDKNRDRFVIFHEVAINSMRGIALLSFAGLFMIVDNIAVAFPIAGMASLFFLFFTKGRNKNDK